MKAEYNRIAVFAARKKSHLLIGDLLGDTASGTVPGDDPRTGGATAGDSRTGGAAAGEASGGDGRGQ